MTSGALSSAVPKKIRRSADRSPSTLAARIGPNAVLQTLRALEEMEGAALSRAVATDAELPLDWPEGLIPEDWFLRVIASVRGRLPARRAEAVLARSGELTAAYVTAHRIPAPFRKLLAVLPARVAIPLLLRAFGRHAWTFAGSGQFSFEGPYPGTIVLTDGPTCRVPTPAPRGGRYYEAAFQNLLTLASPDVAVFETACRASGDLACRFEIRLESSHHP